MARLMAAIRTTRYDLGQTIAVRRVWFSGKARAVTRTVAGYEDTKPLLVLLVQWLIIIGWGTTVGTAAGLAVRMFLAASGI